MAVTFFILQQKPKRSEFQGLTAPLGSLGARDLGTRETWKAHILKGQGHGNNIPSYLNKMSMKNVIRSTPYTHLYPIFSYSSGDQVQKEV